jgi:hypothetical protein
LIHPPVVGSPPCFTGRRIVERLLPFRLARDEGVEDGLAPGAAGSRHGPEDIKAGVIEPHEVETIFEEQAVPAAYEPPIV